MAPRSLMINLSNSFTIEVLYSNRTLPVTYNCSNTSLKETFKLTVFKLQYSPKTAETVAATRKLSGYGGLLRSEPWTRLVFGRDGEQKTP